MPGVDDPLPVAGLLTKPDRSPGPPGPVASEEDPTVRVELQQAKDQAREGRGCVFWLV